MKIIYSVLIISSAITFSTTSTADEKHYMSHNGEGPQGHMMEGKMHKPRMDDNHQIVSETKTKKQPSTNEHYMAHSGDAPQGHMMKGEKHPSGVSTEHVEQYGNDYHSRAKGQHYMMEGGDGPQGSIMKGDKHPSN